MSRILAPLLALSITIAAGSLIGDAAALQSHLGGCCHCFDCSGFNSTAGAACKTVNSNASCIGLCGNLDCMGSNFTTHTTCGDEPSATQCAAAANLDFGAMAPAASPLGLTVLAALLSGFGAFYLRRRRS